jgi:hypothetical protein
LQPLSGLCGSMVAVSITLPNSYRSMSIALSMLLLMGFTVLMIYVSQKYRDLTLEDSALMFRKTMIRGEEIKYIFIPDKMSSVIIHFQKRKPGVTIAFDRTSAGEFRSDLRQWAWKNGVRIKTERPFKRGE